MMALTPLAAPTPRWSVRPITPAANWYCRVLKPGRDMQQRFMLLDSVATFDGMVASLRDRGAPPEWRRDCQLAIAVPQGPNERW